MQTLCYQCNTEVKNAWGYTSIPLMSAWHDVYTWNTEALQEKENRYEILSYSMEL
jgi:hypothetical protein